MRLMFEATYQVAQGEYTVMTTISADRQLDMWAAAIRLYDDARHYDGECLSIRYKSLEVDNDHWHYIPLDLLRPYEGE